jgi:hypothetical protein
VKNFVATFFIFTYLIAVFHTSLILVDFYWNRADYTAQYCVNLDRGITTCRASCYLAERLEQEQEKKGTPQIALSKNQRTAEFSYQPEVFIPEMDDSETLAETIYQDNYFFDFTTFVFHPPRS